MKFSLLPDKSPEDVEIAMKKVSLVVALVALTLMLGGLVDFVIHGNATNLPGAAVTPLPAFLHPFGSEAGMSAMSAGVVLLGLLPAVRVMLALGIYLRRRDMLDVAVSTLVVLELLLSMATGGG